MTTLKDYPYFPAANEAEAREQLRQICNIRKDDITQIQNLSSTFLAGRKVGKVPASSADVDAATDKVNDINWDASYIYVLIDNAGTPVWRRATLAAW